MKKMKAIVFDAYGTLFDVHTVVEKCEQFFPNKGKWISEIWRQKQLEYTWLRSLMGRYEDFWKVTHDSLVYTLKDLGLHASENTCLEILNEYHHLKAYPEVPKTLKELRSHSLAILSNGSPHMLNEMVNNAGLKDVFNKVISVDELKIFKPSMEVYELAPASLGVQKEEILFVSSNSWDATGAKVFGFKVCWINRFNKTFDELDTQPDLIVKNLDEMIQYCRD